MIKYILYYIVLIFLFEMKAFALEQKKNKIIHSSERKDCVQKYNATNDYFKNKVNIKYANKFRVTYHKHYKIVTIYNKSKKSNIFIQYILVQCGTPIPKKFKDSIVIQIPVKKVVALSTTYLPFFSLLHLENFLIGVSDYKSITTKSISKKIKQGHIKEVGREIDLNLENIISLGPNILFGYQTQNNYAKNATILKKVGIHKVILKEYLETLPLGRTEWIKFVSLFFNKEKKANLEFQFIDEGYQKIKSLVQNIHKKPTVFTGLSYKGTWYMPGGNTYVAHFLKDAGANYLWSKNKSKTSLPLDFELVFNRAFNADYWLHPGIWKTKQQGLVEDSRYQFFLAFKKNRIYNNNLRLNQHGANDYWETGIVKPHIILADFIKIFHPTKLPKHKLIFHKQLQ